MEMAQTGGRDGIEFIRQPETALHFTRLCLRVDTYSCEFTATVFLRLVALSVQMGLVSPTQVARAVRKGIRADTAEKAGWMKDWPLTFAEADQRIGCAGPKIEQDRASN